MVQMSYPTVGPSFVETLPLPPPPTHSNVEPITFSGDHAKKLVEGRRISGNKLIAPDDDIKTAIGKSRVDTVRGNFRVCLDESGSVESVLPLRSTGYASYDRKIMGGIMSWKYSPYLVDDKPVPVCTGVNFIYTQR